MSTYDSTPVDDSTYSISLTVTDGDNLLDLTAGDGETATMARLNIEETLTLIASLTGALSAMIDNNA